ncbi:MAG: DUF4254 domain-containing protein [Bacteroidales bacterium]|nr:DUF4254 domain-containing protein [Bacteroidales bacterium]
MNFVDKAYSVFEQSIKDYHVLDSVDAQCDNPYPSQSIESLFYLKNHIDSVQWHLEDIIRRPDIKPAEALSVKRRIDQLNQNRTDLVETIDGYIVEAYKDVVPAKDATINTETPAWALDRLSILALKIYHWTKETERTDCATGHVSECRLKLNILIEQRKDLSASISQLLDDISSGRKIMKTYRQMKMYNDPNLNPELYGRR